MNRKIYNIHSLWSLLLLFVVGACTSEADEWQPEVQETPIEFEFLMPDDGQATTRTKTVFANGDNVYITAKVMTDASTEVVSTILEYQGGKFQPASGSTRLTWPAGAVSAEFRAYYLPETHNAAPTEGNPLTIPLNELKESDTNDDLLLAQQKIVNLNGVVTLRFAHTTSKLRFSGLKKEATSLELIPQKDEFKINNQLVVSYSVEKGYTHEFENNGQDNGITMTKGTDATTVLFFLNGTSEWARETFVFTQVAASPAETKETELPDASSRLSTMKVGRAYGLTFYSGGTSSTLEEEEQWYGEKEEITFDSVEAIMDYMNGRTSLDQDLDFNNILLDDPAIIFPATRSIQLGGNTFDGNHYTIRNVYVRNGLFGAIPASATIQNLRLENVKVLAENGEAAGLLAPSNAGTIDNVRIAGSNQIGTSNVSSVGGLVGTNTGTIIDVQLSGALLIEPYIESDTEATKIFALGGLVGANTGTITNCEINAGGLLQPAGTYTAGEATIGGMVGRHTGANIISDCTTSVRVDATRLTAKTGYVGGFCGASEGKLKDNKANGEVRGSSFISRSATGGFLGFTATGTASVDGCGATGNVTESACDKATAAEPELYTGGFCGFSEIDLKNTYSVGTLIPTTTVPSETVRRKGALTGLISADKTIYNSFSITDEQGIGTLHFSGSEDTENICKTQNAHLRGKMLSEQGVVMLTEQEPKEAIKATIARLNNAVSTANGYWSWNSSDAIYGGVPYIVK